MDALEDRHAMEWILCAGWDAENAGNAEDAEDAGNAGDVGDT